MQADVLKIHVLGDFYAAKCFLHRVVFDDVLPSSNTQELIGPQSNFPFETHAPTYVLDNDKYYTPQFWHISGGEEGLRPLYYPCTHLFVVVFDVLRTSSFQNISGLFEEVKMNMPNSPLLLIATKVCQSTECENETLVTMTEAHDMARRMGSLCVECCPVSGEGIQEAAHLMIHMAVYGQKPTRNKICLFKKKEQKRLQFTSPVGLVVDPSGIYGMENAPKCPSVNVLASTSVEDLAKMKDDATCKDVRFTFQESPLTPIEAHQVILTSAAPELFQEIFTGTTKSQVSGRPQELFEKVSWPAAHPVDNNIKRIVELRVCEKVPRKQFLKLLEFLYVGASIADLHKDDSIYELITIAKMFNLSELLEACENVLEGNEMENIPKPSFVGGGKATVLKDLFFNKPLLEDLVFLIQENVIYAHQAVVIARSHILAAMIADYRRDHPECIRVKVVIDEVSMETFKRLLEYLYTDDVSRDLAETVLLDLIGLASSYQLPRLFTLCEYLLIVKLQEEDERITARVVTVFLAAKRHDAHHLIKWCLNLMARNHARFKSSTDFDRLSDQDKDYVDVHQWPPKCQLSVEHHDDLLHYLAERNSHFSENSTSGCTVV